jgi:ABC-type nickel/cobalt efflux system permease component RcnA
MSSWAVDLKDVADIYPFQGSEVLMVIVGVAFWLIWHVVQMRQESVEVQHEMDADASGDKAKAAIDRY